jgi:hypothetical protein
VIERVDVFFVISGFLITNIIVQDIEVGHFSFSAFYPSTPAASKAHITCASDHADRSAGNRRFAFDARRI